MKDKYKHLLNFAANIISLTVEAAMFGWVWYMLYVPMLDKANALFRRGNWAVIGMYALFVFFHEGVRRIPDRIYADFGYYIVPDTGSDSCNDSCIF